MAMPPRPPVELATGTHRLHQDPSINFQLNRWIAWTSGSALGDIRGIAPRLSDYDTNRLLFLGLADTADSPRKGLPRVELTPDL